jgi:hypothetical protein
VSGEALARFWKDPDAQRDWPDDDHPAGAMYLYQNAMVGGLGQIGEPDPDPLPNPAGDPNPAFPFSRITWGH